MSKKGLPVTIKMRHDSHYVEHLAGKNSAIGRTISIDLIEPNPEQPRTEIGDLTELSGSIKEKGVLEPILVKPNPKAGTWMIIAGERRWRAANLAGLTEMPCVELDIDEKDIAEIALIENLQRKDLTVWEEVDGYAYLIDKFDYTHEEIAKKIGKSRTTITESLTVAGLPDDIRAKCRQAGITAKSALLEVARQFDEPAMHAYLNEFGNAATKRENKKQSNSLKKKFVESGSSEEQSTNNSRSNNPTASTSGEAASASNNFVFSSPRGDFDLRINFLKTNEYDRKDILAALKEVYGAVNGDVNGAVNKDKDAD